MSDTYTVSRRGGLEFNESWNSALRYGTDTIIVDSFNNWIDGTEIEPAFTDHATEETWATKDPYIYMKTMKEMITKF